MKKTDIARALKVRRVELGISLKDLAERLGIGAGGLSAREKGLVDVSMGSALAWAAELGLTLREVAARAETLAPKKDVGR